MYEFDIDMKKLIIVKTYEDIKKINDMYGLKVKSKLFSKYKYMNKYKNYFVDWTRLQRDSGKAGFYVKNALIKQARDEFMWYYGFDVESMSIWNNDAIKSFRLYKTLA